MAISLRIPENVKKRVARVAARRDTTAHAFMLEAIREKVDNEEARIAFHEEAIGRLARMKNSGLAVPAGEVFDYLRERARGGKPVRPKARAIA
ncbi:MAG: ribbon-helix-helix protein, CopG family [Betaproteobacteria bacterium]|nr:ribbon-helix-helix protein, CopG family [Betaproteobacteria bacterium]